MSLITYIYSMANFDNIRYNLTTNYESVSSAIYNFETINIS